MIAMMHFATLVVTTVFAGGAAVLFNWLLLRAALHLMRPATARRIGSPVRNELVRGTGELARAFAGQR
jgi:hypothetical protein